MRSKILLLAVGFILLLNIPKGYTAEWTPAAHGLFALTSHYALERVCESTVKRFTDYKYNLTTRRLGCTIFSTVVVGSIVYAEHRSGRMMGGGEFSNQDFKADLIGIGISIPIIQW